MNSRQVRRLLLLFWVCACAADAHLLNMTRVTVETSTDTTGMLEIEIDLGQSLLSPEAYLTLARSQHAKREEALEAVLTRIEAGLTLSADNRALPMEVVDATFVADSLQAIRNPLTPQMATLRWRIPATDAPHLQAALGSTFELPWPCLVRVDSARRALPASRLLTPDRRDSGPIPLTSEAPDRASDDLVDVAFVYGWLGIQHIIPKGMDHVLFVLGLFFVGGRRRELALLISCFTVAHTLTLAAATLGVVDLPATIVEPLIAASIVYVGAEALFGRGHSRLRYFVVFAFGLLHGLGFASVLREIGLPDGLFIFSLLSFNVGVEIGQLAVLAAAFVTLGALQARPAYTRWIAQPGAMIVAGTGAYWLIQRLS